MAPKWQQMCPKRGQKFICGVSSHGRGAREEKKSLIATEIWRGTRRTYSGRFLISPPKHEAHQVR